MSKEELPEGWAETTMGELGDLHCGQSPAKSEVNQEGHGHPYVSGPDQWNGREIRHDKWTTSSRRMVPGGCIFITVKGAGVGTTFPGGACIIGRDIYAFKPHPDLSTKLVHFALDFEIHRLIAQSAGLIPGLSRDHILNHAIALPPLAEQRRIVEKVEALLAEVNAARARIAKVPTILKRFRQSILSAACSGRLTEDWRASNGPTDTGQELLECIWKARRDRNQSGDERPKSGTLGPHSNPEGPFAIPETWTWAIWNDLADWITYGFTRPMPHVPRGVPIVTAKNIFGGRIDLSTADFTTREAFSELSAKDVPRLGEILVTKDGSIGRMAVVSETRQFCINQSVAVVRFGGASADPYFLKLVGEAPFTQTLIDEGAKGSAIRHISITAFGEFPVPLPPLAEQHEIVRCVDALFKLADTIEAHLAAATARADKLTQAILAKAFRGELVPTEAELARQEGRDYEPASALLARIRAKRAANEAAPNPSARTRRAEPKPTETAKPTRRRTIGRTARPS